MVPRPRFFVVRPDVKRQTSEGGVRILPGAIVPLVAVDELPEWLDLVGVPRELAIEQTIGLCNLGTAAKSKSPYAVKIKTARPSPSAEKKREVKPDNDAAPVDGNGMASNPHLPPHPSASSPSETNVPTTAAAPAPSPSPIHPADRMKAHWSDAHARSLALINDSDSDKQHRYPQPQSSTAPSPSTTSTITTSSTISSSLAPSNKKKNDAPEYCRHWCHHGTCKWGLHCRYLHAMPTTPAELAAVGLREVPAWWVAASAAGEFGEFGAAQHHHHHGGLGFGGHGMGIGMGLDPRDVRVRLPLPFSIPFAGAGGRTGVFGGGGGVDMNMNTNMGMGMGMGMGMPSAAGGGSGGKKAMRAAAQLRETVALLRELGVVGIGVGGGGGRSRRARERERERTPMEKSVLKAGKGKVDKEKDKEKEAALRAAAEDRPTAGSAAAAAGTVHSGVALPVRGGEVPGKKRLEEEEKEMAVASAQKMQKLVDV
ncbi:hypothetical protein VTK56DRAFT_2829 [Thermocarpiscus australiensis]